MTNNTNILYWYNAYVVSVYDGDTIRADIDLGFGIWMHRQRIRLFGIDTPELRGEEREDGLRSRDYLRERILRRDVLMHSHRDRAGKYGRWLAQIWIDEILVNDELVEQGLATVVSY